MANDLLVNSLAFVCIVGEISQLINARFMYDCKISGYHEHIQRKRNCSDQI